MKDKKTIPLKSCLHSTHEASWILELKNIIKNEQRLWDVIEYSKIMSDMTRGSIIFLLYKKWGLCVCDLASTLDMSSQAISNQLIKLYDKRIITRQKKGLSVYYSLIDKNFISFLSYIL